MDISYCILAFAVIVVGVLALIFFYQVNKRMDELEDIHAEYLAKMEEAAETKEEEELADILREMVKANEPAPDPEEENELAIHLITPEQFFFECQIYEKYTLYYNQETGDVKFIAKDGEIITVENVKEVVGDGLMFFGMHSKDPNRVFVRNNIFLSDFEIIKEME